MQIPAYCTALSVCHYNDPTLAAASLRRGDFSENLDNHVVGLNCRESQGKDNSDGWRLLSRLSLGKTAKLRATETPSQAFGAPSNLLSGIPSSVPCAHFDACRAKGVPSMRWNWNCSVLLGLEVGHAPGGNSVRPGDCRVCGGLWRHSLTKILDSGAGARAPPGNTHRGPGSRVRCDGRG